MMPTLTHTPGPWKVNARLTIEDANGEFIADAAQIEYGESGEYSLDTAEPNARLIASAPELLQATLALYALLATDARYEGGECMDLALAAITKATGQ